MTYDLTPGQVRVIRAWGNAYRDDTLRHAGTRAVGLQLGYGRGDAREAQSAWNTALRRRRLPAETMHRLAYLVYRTSPDASWPRLRLTTPADDWATIAHAVDAIRGFDPAAVPDALAEAA